MSVYHTPPTRANVNKVLKNIDHGNRLHWSPAEHYDSMSMQFTAIINSCKNCNFQMKICDFFLFLLKNIDGGYTASLRKF